MSGVIMINDGSGFYTIPMGSTISDSYKSSGVSWNIETKTGNARCAFYCNKKRSGDRLLYAQFNPEKLEYEYSATYAEMKSPGMSYPVFQFINGNASEFQIELFMYEGRGGSGESIKYVHDWFAECLPPRKNTNSFIPPKIDIRHGYYKLKGVLKSMKVVDEWINDSGKPIMSRLNLTFIRVGDSTNL